MRRFLVPCLAVFLLTHLSACSTQESGVSEPESLIILVRHAERADDAGADPSMMMDPQMRADPPLSAAGEARAMQLAQVLKDTKLTDIYSTDVFGGA